MQMIGYVTIGTNDFDDALPFYDEVLGAVGYSRGPFEGGWAFYTSKTGGDIGICKPFDGQPARGGNGIMVAFKAETKDAVQAAYDAALANGGTNEGAPGMRPPEGTSFYGAYVRDPDGNKLCIFHSPG
jgi:catechol 2,3-dioxygenase-like lactoylglutathione lyase family enzyme